MDKKVDENDKERCLLLQKKEKIIPRSGRFKRW